MTKLKWIFFDVGSTLVDETAAYDHRVRDMIANTDISFDAFDKMRVTFAMQGYDGNSEAIKYFGLQKTPWHSEDEVPFADTEETLKSLRYQRGCNLGIIANQALGMTERLKAWGLLQYFDVVVASAEVGISKPDRAIFEKALALANCTPEESMMVGDRLDNDIAPAKALGMKAVWLRNGLAKYQSTELGDNIADYQISTLSELLRIV